MSVSGEHCLVMSKIGEFADNQWETHGPFIAGDKPFNAVHMVAVGMAHPPLPIFMYYLGMMPMASNGARVELWGSPDPMAMCVLNVNHSQTRKSRLTGQAERLSGFIDDTCAGPMMEIWNAKLSALNEIKNAKRRRGAEPDAVDPVEPAAGAADGDERVVAFPGVFSVAFLGGTIERVRERCAGDCPAVRQTKIAMSLPGLGKQVMDRDFKSLNLPERAMAVKPGMSGRVWFGQGLLYDEVYQFLQDISILDKPQEKKASEATGSGQTPLAGWFNRLVQCGVSDHETKSNGSHGGLSCPTVSVSLLGNFHPTPAIEMVRGLRGDHGCQAKARLMLVTGRPVQPHEMYADTDELKCRADWFPVPNELLEDVGLGSCGSLATFKAFFKIAEEEDIDEGGEFQEHVPSKDGVDHVLPDLVPVCVRMSLEGGRYRLMWLLPDRQLEIPEDMQVAERFKTFLKHGAQTPHRTIEMTTAGKGAFKGYQTMYNIKVKMSRDENDPDAGAEWGIAPWKLGQLAAALLCWDIMWGITIVPYREYKWEIDVHHIQRAHHLLRIMDGIKQGLCTDDVPVPDGIPNPAAMVKLGNDRNLIGCPNVNGTTGTEVARRILGKASPTTTPNEYKCHAMKAFVLFTKKEHEKVGKVSVYTCRDIMKECPLTIGKFSALDDSLVFQVPPETSVEYDTALAEYANTTSEALLRCLKTVVKKGGARRGAAAASQAAA
jgi:hypothetical protein